MFVSGGVSNQASKHIVSRLFCFRTATLSVFKSVLLQAAAAQRRAKEIPADKTALKSNGGETQQHWRKSALNVGGVIQ